MSIGDCMNWDNLFTVKKISGLVSDKYWSAAIMALIPYKDYRRMRCIINQSYRICIQGALQ